MIPRSPAQHRTTSLMVVRGALMHETKFTGFLAVGHQIGLRENVASRGLALALYA